MPLETARFSGHQSFAFRNTWLTKGVLACQSDPAVFRQPDALVTLGVGKNMVDAIKYWCLATRVIEDSPDQKGTYRPSIIGRRLFLPSPGWDPYMEDAGTLWLLHWLLATHGEYATTIYYAFNELTTSEFTRDTMEQHITDLAQRLEVRAAANTIRRDVGVFIRTYLGGADRANPSVEDTLDCPLAELGLLYEEALGQAYALLRGPKDSLPDAIVIYATWDYMRQHGDHRTFTFDELAYRPLSPGRVFRLDDLALAERLERLVELTHGAWQFAETAGYRQILATHDIDPYEVLDEYYSHSVQG